MTSEGDYTIIAANRAGCDDLGAILGERGEGARCQCQRYKLAPREAFKHHPAQVRAERLRSQTRCGHPDGPTSGLVAYLGAEPVGWCAVEPRNAYAGLARVYRVPWAGRAEDKADGTVWAVTCFFARAGYRRRGVSRALAAAAVDHARAGGARAVEGYPMITEPGREIAWGELHVGSHTIFAAAGFREVGRPTPRRAVMRIDF